MGLTNASKIIQSIKEIGTANLSIEEDTKIYLLNRKLIEDISIEYYNDLYLSFQIFLYTQLREKCDVILLNKFLEETKPLIKDVQNLNRNLKAKFLDAKNQENVLLVKNIQNIRARLFTIEKTLNKIVFILEDEMEFFDYRISSDYQFTINSLEQKISSLPNFYAGKATFKMSKKETLMLLFLLEQKNLLKFDNDVQKKKFIENNFNYTEMRENKDNFEEPCELIGIGKDFTNFISNDNSDINSNNKTLELLLKKLDETIHEYQFKITKYK